MKKKRIRIEEGAIDDLNRHIDFYEERKRGLGKEFKAEFNETKQRIKENPYQFPKAHGIGNDSFRRAMTNRFPFKVFYAIFDKVISIFRVSHQHEDTGGLDDND